jgi:RNA polymerase sigma-70 factor (ECF subfamily)
MTAYDLGVTTPRVARPSDTAIFEARLAEYMPFLRMRALAMIRHRELAEDMVQEAAAKAWGHRQSFVPGTNMKAWLSTILINQFYSYRRRQWRQIPWKAELESRLVLPPDGQKWFVELSEVACAMNFLSKQLRDTMILVSMSGFSYEETSLLFKVSLGTVKSRVCRARKSLRMILDGQGSHAMGLSPAGSKSLAEWFAQVDRLDAFARRTLVSRDFDNFSACRKTRKMAVVKRIDVDVPTGAARDSRRVA